MARDQTCESKKTKKRIERLESLVKELLERGSLNQEYVSKDTFAINETGDHAQQCQTQGVSGNHKEVSLSPSQREIPPVRIVPNLAASSSRSSLWESVLQDVSLLSFSNPNKSRKLTALQIGEIKMYFEEHEEDFEKQHDKVDAKNQFPAEPYMLEGNPSQWDVDTFLHDIPSRPVADILVDHYFAKSSLVRRRCSLLITAFEYLLIITQLSSIPSRSFGSTRNSGSISPMSQKSGLERYT